MSLRRPRIKRAAPTHFRPLAEPLEDRRLLAPLFVTNALDNGSNILPTPGSLRAAILGANATPGPDTILFTIKTTSAGHVYYRDDGVGGQLSRDNVTPMSVSPDTAVADIDPDWPHSWWSIRLAAPLPEIREAVTIDGYTQLDARRNTLAVGSDAVLRIELDGGVAGPFDGLLIGAGNCVVRGLVINRFAASGIHLRPNGFNVIEGNYLGTDVSGTLALGNHDRGVLAEGGASLIGTNDDGFADAAERNIISGNGADGVAIFGSQFNNHIIAGNYIGTDASGTRELGNAANGVLVSDAEHTIIGSFTGRRGTGNVISGNAQNGVLLTSRAIRTQIRANFIGLDATGASFLSNRANGVVVDGSPETVIGGLTTTPGTGAGNVISGNWESGISLLNSGSSTVIQGNIIGLDASGMGALGSLIGISTTNAGAQIGGTDLRARNVITGAVGIYLSNSGNPFDTAIEGNYIGTDITGNQGLLYGGSYVAIESAPGTRVGGTAPGAGNVISGDSRFGVRILGISRPVIDGRYNAVVQGNIIGLNAAGTVAFSDQQYLATGVEVRNGNNLIGGTEPAARNVISGHETEILIGTLDTDGNQILGNYIGTDASGADLGTRRNAWGVEIEFGDNTLIAGNLIAFNLLGVVTEFASGTRVLANSFRDNIHGDLAMYSFEGRTIDVIPRSEIVPGSGARDVAILGDGVTLVEFDDTVTGHVEVGSGSTSITVNTTGATAGLTLYGDRRSDRYIINLGPLVEAPITVNDYEVYPGTDTLIVNGTPDDETIERTFDGTTQHIQRTAPTTQHIIATGIEELTIDGKEGSDSYVIQLGSLLGPVTIADSGTTGTDALTVNGTDEDETIDKTFDGITRHIQRTVPPDPTVEEVFATGIETATIDGGPGDDYITDPGEGTIILGGDGDDTIIVTATFGGGLLADGGNGSDTFIVQLGSLLGPVTIADSGTTGSDALTVLGTEASDTLVLTGNQVQNGSETIVLAAPLTSLSVLAGGGDDNVAIVDFTAPVSHLTVDGGAGTNHVTIEGSLPPGMTLNLIGFTQSVQIDVARNSINLASNGIITAALFSTPLFDAARVDVSSVLFAGAHVVHSALADIDGDGDLDRILQFRTQDTNLRALYTQLVAADISADGVLNSPRQAAAVLLTGKTVDGVFFEGFDDLEMFLAGKSLRELLADLAAAGAI